MQREQHKQSDRRPITEGIEHQPKQGHTTLLIDLSVHMYSHAKQLKITGYLEAESSEKIVFQKQLKILQPNQLSKLDTLRIPYLFEVRQQLTFVFTQGKAQLHSRSETVIVAEVLENASVGLIKTLRNSSSEITGYIKIAWRKIIELNQLVNLQIRTNNVESERGCFCFCSQDIYYRVQQRIGQRLYTIGGDSRPGNPNDQIFPKISFTSRQKVEDTQAQPYILQFFNFSSNTLIGSAKLPENQLEKGQKKYMIRGQQGEGRGEVLVLMYKRLPEPSLADYIINGMGCALKIGLDFSATHPNSTSLHTFDDNKRSVYQHALEQSVTIFADYCSEDEISLYGFGAKVDQPGFYPNIVSDYFRFDACVDRPAAKGIEGILWQYRQIVPHLTLSGPVNLSVSLRQAVSDAQLLRQKGKYLFLVLLTTGNIVDEQQVLDLVVACDRLPISILFLTMGSGQNPLYSLLDDKMVWRNSFGQTCQRKMVTFVRYNHDRNVFSTAMTVALTKVERQIIQYHRIEHIQSYSYHQFLGSRQENLAQILRQRQNQLEKERSREPQPTKPDKILSSKRKSMPQKKISQVNYVQQLKRKEVIPKRKEVIPQHMGYVSGLKQKRKSNNPDKECPICLDRQVDVQTVCRHKFCRICIERTLKIRNFCPMCRHFNPLGKDEEQEAGEEVVAQEEWNLDVVRRVIYEQVDENTRQLYLQGEGGQREATNVFVSKNAKIQCSENANIFINGKRVNPNECNQQ